MRAIVGQPLRGRAHQCGKHEGKMTEQSRRDFVRTVAAATVSAGSISPLPNMTGSSSTHLQTGELISDLSTVPERTWIGPDFWANRLEDWRVRDSRIECLADDPLHSVRTVHFITREVQPGSGSFRLSARTGIIARNDGKGWTGFLVGAGAGKLDHSRVTVRP